MTLEMVERICDTVDWIALYWLMVRFFQHLDNTWTRGSKTKNLLRE